MGSIPTCPSMDYNYNDGGRGDHFKGVAGDCVTRAITNEFKRYSFNKDSNYMTQKIIV